MGQNDRQDNQDNARGPVSFSGLSNVVVTDLITDVRRNHDAEAAAILATVTAQTIQDALTEQIDRMSRAGFNLRSVSLDLPGYPQGTPVFAAFRAALMQNDWVLDVGERAYTTHSRIDIILNQPVFSAAVKGSSVPTPLPAPSFTRRLLQRLNPFAKKEPLALAAPQKADENLLANFNKAARDLAHHGIPGLVLDMGALDSALEKCREMLTAGVPNRNEYRTVANRMAIFVEEFQKYALGAKTAAPDTVQAGLPALRDSFAETVSMLEKANNRAGNHLIEDARIGLDVLSFKNRLGALPPVPSQSR